VNTALLISVISTHYTIVKHCVGPNTNHLRTKQWKGMPTVIRINSCIITLQCTILSITLPISVTARSKAWVCLLGFWVRIPPGRGCLSLVKCSVLSGRGLCDGLITRPEESYRLWCVVVCDPETSRMRRLWPA
jgi:hypothetical protein